MKTAVGTCKYCNQTKGIMVPESFDQKTVDEEVTKQCNCEEALYAKRIEDNITYTTSEINKFFKDREGFGTFKKLLLNAVEPVARGDIEKISMSREEYSVAMKKGKDGIDVRITCKTVEVM